MAPELKPVRLWVAGVALACLTIGVAYLPPRGGAPESASRLAASRPVTAKRARANALMWEWRDADQAVRLAEFRTTLRSQIAALQRADRPGPALVFDGPLPDSARVLIAAQLDSVWRRLQLGLPKVAVGVVVSTPPPPSGPVAGARVPTRQERSSPAYLLPDSTDRGMCVALAPLDRWTRRQLEGGRQMDRRRLETWLRGGLGVCAFYAAFGIPGERIDRWLKTRRFDLTIAVEWDRPAGRRRAEWFGEDPAKNPWFWRMMYAMPPGAVACVGGRVSACRDAVLQGADGTMRSGTLDTDRWWRSQLLFGSEWYLSDLVRELGRDRVARFWSSDLPVDTAFVEAMGMDIGRWTRRWEAEQLAPLPLGPRPPWSAAALSIVLAGVAAAASAGLATRRRVA